MRETSGPDPPAGAPEAIAAQAAATAPPVVALQRVAKTFSGATVALADFDLEVRAGEFVSLLGPSGCGKSPALRLSAGLTQPTSGAVLWTAEAQAPGRRRAGGHAHEIGFVFQEPTLMPWATVFDNVFLPLRLQRMARAAATPRVLQALGGVGLSDFSRAYPRELSGGMRMRVSIARALVTSPEVLLMDEPFAALDEITRFRLNDDLLALHRDLGMTVVFVTHSVFESVYLSSRIVVMTHRPGRAFCEIAVDAPYPRDERFRTSVEYAALCRSTSQSLSAALAGA